MKTIWATITEGVGSFGPMYKTTRQIRSSLQLQEIFPTNKQALSRHFAVYNVTLLSLCCSLFKFNLIDQLSSRGIVIFNQLILGKLSHRNWYIYFIINSLKCLYKCPCFSSLAHYVHNYHKNKWCIKRLCNVELLEHWLWHRSPCVRNKHWGLDLFMVWLFKWTGMG